MCIHLLFEKKTLPGEMHWMPSSPGSWFNLPRDRGVAYAAQESWVQNDTIKVRRLCEVDPSLEPKYNC